MSGPQNRVRFANEPAAARAYVALVVVAGVVCLVAAAVRVRFDQAGLFAALMALAVGTSAAKIKLPLGRNQSTLSLSHAVNFWALFSLGAAPAVCIATVSAWAQCTLRADTRNPPHRVIFSVASLTLTMTVAGLPFGMIAGGDRSIEALARAATLIAPLYFFVNSGLVAAAIALSARQPVLAIWQRHFLWSAPSYFAGAAFAVTAAVAADRGWFGWLALLAIPLYLVFRSYDSVVTRLREEQNQTQQAMRVQLATIEALALAIEARAGCTPEHIRSIQQYAALLAEACGMSDEQVQSVRTAALLHDIGNMAVPEHILSKPDALTPEEFERIKIHPRVGAEILQKVPFVAPVSELVLYHHERWDGLGYPAGLRGEDIPLGARILAIADCYSTMQADRPYRLARSQGEAISVLREFAGTAFDPTLVDLLIDRLTEAATVGTVDSVNERGWMDTNASALQDIAGAHREEQTLYEIAQALGSKLSVAEAMVLIQDKMNRLVPFTTCALFLGDDVQGYICRYAHGPGTEALLKWAPKSWSDLALRLPSCADGRGPHGEELHSVLPCRLMFEGALIGGLLIYDTTPQSFTDEHRRVIGRVSEQAAAVIYNSTRFEQSEQESQTDALTGLPNRRLLERQLELGLRRAAHTNSNVSVVVLDLDRLKEINDTWGHEAGDRSIRAVGHALRSTVRQDDLGARFAGDEFMVVLWNCSPEHERRRVEELQDAVASYPFEPRPGVRVSLSISAGAARYPEDGRSFEDLMTIADERMYRDKASRRSRHAGRHAIVERA